MGSGKHTPKPTVFSRARQPGARICLRKGCGRRYVPRRWNQRYCQDPECLRLLRRWQAARRQRRCRAMPQRRQKHAEAQQQRRKQLKANGAKPPGGPTTCCNAQKREAWSRSKNFFRGPLCSRPGCYQPPRHSIRAPACYCDDSCRIAVRRVNDRERKWLARNSSAGRLKRHYEYQAAKAKRRQSLASSDRVTLGSEAPYAQHLCGAVVPYSNAPDPPLRWLLSQEVKDHDRETSAGSPARPPPSS